MAVSIVSVTYSGNSNQLSVLVTGGGGVDMDFSHLTLTGQGGAGDAVTLAGTVSAFTSGGNFNYQYNASGVEAATLNRIFSAAGASAADGNGYNTAFTADYITGESAITNQATTVLAGSWARPTITSATYNKATGVLAVTGSHLINTVGAANDITLAKLVIAGQGTAYTLTSASKVEVTGPTGFSVTLSGADLTAVNAALDRNGTASSGSTTYNISGIDGWNGTVAVNDDVPGGGITVQGNVPATTVTSVSFALDTGTGGDFITSKSGTGQTVSGNLSGVLGTGEIVELSLDNGASWVTANNPTTSTWRLMSRTLLAGSNTLQVRVTTTGVGSSTPLTQAYVLDTTAPVFASAAVNGNSLVMSYTEAVGLDATNLPANGAFTVQVGGAADAVTGVAVNSAAKTVTLTLTTAATAGQAVTVAYNDPTGGDDANAVQDTAGNDAATLTAQAVTNNTLAVPDSTPSTPTTGVTLTAPPGGGTVTGSTNNDTLIGQDGNDTFVPNGGRDVINGGGGTDTVVISGGRSNYTVTHNSNGSFTLQSKSDPNTILNLTGIERVKFDGQTIALDVTANSGKAADMYTLALGRNPEDAGLVYWANTLDKGLSDVDLARSFVNSKEFAALYGSLSDTAFITQFYQTAFGRAPEAAGLAYFQDLLSHVTGANGRANLLATFVDSAEMQAKLVGQVDQGIPLLATA